MADPIFDIALLKRFTDDPQAVLVDITPSDTLLIRNSETGVIMRLPFSVLANAVSGALVGYLKAANNLSDVADAGTARTNLGATTLGSNLFTVPNPGAVRFPRFNADNTVSSLTASDFRTAIGAGTSSTTGTVTSVGVSVPTGLSVSGSPVTSSGTIAISYAAGYSIPSDAAQSGWSSKEPGITAWTTAQYWRGDKSWQTLNTAAVAESTNLYYTNARARGALSSSGPITYDSATGVFGFSGTLSTLNIQTHIDNNGIYYHRSNSAYLNAAGNSWTTWFDRNGGSPIITVPSFVGALTGNASTATKLATARTIAGASFDGSANIDIPFSGLSSKPTTLAGYGITDAAAKTNPSLSGGMIYQAQPITITALNTGVAQSGTNAISGILRFRDNSLGGAALFVCDPNGGITTLVNQITGLTVSYNSGSGFVLEAKLTSGSVSRNLSWSMVGGG